MSNGRDPKLWTEAGNREQVQGLQICQREVSVLDVQGQDSLHGRVTQWQGPNAQYARKSLAGGLDEATYARNSHFYGNSTRDSGGPILCESRHQGQLILRESRYQGQRVRIDQLARLCPISRGPVNLLTQ